jgi:hypothetical protein
MANNDEETVTIEMSENMTQVLGFSLHEALSKLAGENGFTPFTVVLSGENLSIEEQEGDNPDECRANAQHTLEVDPASVDGYAFVYDGYVQIDEAGNDTRDAIIIECAEVDDAEATVLCYFYDNEVLSSFLASGDEEDAEDVAAEDLAVVGTTDSLIPEDYRVVD